MSEKIKLSNYTYQIAASPNIHSDSTCFAALGSGLFRSQDAGKTWVNVFENMGSGSNYPAINVAVSRNFSNDNFVIAAVPGGFLVSSDGGGAWVFSKLEFSDTIISSLELSNCFDHDGTVFAGTIEDGFLRSVNSGLSWTYWNFGLFDPNILCLSVAPNFKENQLIIIGCETNMYKSVSAGRSWIPIGFETKVNEISAIAFSNNFNNDKTIVAGTLKGEVVISYDDGITWDFLTDRLLGQQILRIELSYLGQGSYHYFFVTSLAMYIVRDINNSWLKISNPGNGEITCALAPYGMGPGNSVFVGTENNGVILVSIPNK